MIAALQRAVQASEPDLAQLRAPTPGDDALMVEGKGSETRARPDGVLLFALSAPMPPDVSSNIYREAETSEFQRRDHERAIRALQPRARSPDPTIRAGALLRTTRNQRKAGQLDAALRTCGDLADHGESSAGGQPQTAPLAGRMDALSIHSDGKRIAYIALSQTPTNGIWIVEGFAVPGPDT